MSDDLSTEAIADVLPGRPIRSYPTILSTEADAGSWARADAPEGAVVVADFQVAARGRGGKHWQVPPGKGLGFSLVLRPQLSAEREGWLYTVASTGLADVVAPEGTIEWPDEVRRGGEVAGFLNVKVALGPAGTKWAVISVLVPEAPPPRAPLLGRVVEAIESRYRGASDAVLEDHRRRCETIGRRFRVRLVSLGTPIPPVTGTAVTTLDDGALQLETDSGRRVGILPHHGMNMVEVPPRGEEEGEAGAPSG